MYEQQQAYGYAGPRPVIEIDSARRAQFVTRTYQHLFFAILGFVLVEMAIFKSGIAYPMAQAMLGTSWLLVLGGFMVAGWLFSGIAARAQGKGAQYGALAGYVLAEAVIFVPILVIAEIQAPGAIASAGLLTLVGFGGLTGIAMSTGKDFTFMGAMLRWIGVAALMLITGSVLFGFQLGMLFSFAMVVFAGATILFTTSRILRTYPEDRYVSAALELFASVALMFWYILRIFSRR
ncbi:Bax inhibitor-1 family protein [Longimicrobium sp.]|uniref:Bax inhibitor-1/YccA family protein n=1 Tax=Longimicrobium sp. TaxID=2029185 RepID=UPI002C1DF0D2|nr:Bax inhibitor-1 family protein [Longimicrobium sp.]HSU12812.1 Bax inhibitor-1 family protein [Longimicrobium sp.]